jgi:hypothetical protein
MDTSIWQGGNKEFCDNLKTLIDKSFILLKVLFRQGRDILESFYQKKLVDDNNESKLLVIYHKLFFINRYWGRLSIAEEEYLLNRH